MSTGDLSLQKSSTSQQSGRSQHSGLSSEHSLAAALVVEEKVEVKVEEHSSMGFVYAVTKDEEKRMPC